MNMTLSLPGNTAGALPLIGIRSYAPHPTGAGSPPYQVSIRQITPEMATLILENFNRNIRALDPNWCEKLAQSMRRGAWEENGTPIRFDAEGFLRDGQHRLTALVRAGVTQSFVVIYGIANDREIDTGKPRTLRTYLSAAGEKNVTLLRALFRLGTAAPEHLKIVASGNSGYDRMTISESLQWVEDNPESREAVAMVRAFRREWPIEGRFVAYIALKALQNGFRAHLDLFLRQLRGLDCGSDSPVAVLRHRLAGSLKSSYASRFAMLLKTWNACRGGRKVVRLSWVEDKESFPSMNVSSS